MAHDHIIASRAQAQSVVAHTLRSHLIHFLRPVAERLAAHLDIRLVQTALDLVQVILTHRHRALGLLLTELGGYLLSPAQAPAGAKRISNLVHAPDFSADDIGAFLWQQARERVQALEVAGEEVLLVWDGSVWEKPESQANADWCVVRSAKARRLSRRRKGMTIPHKGPPILVPGLHWEGLLVVGMDGPPTLAHMEWWTTRGEHATTQRAVDQALLDRSATAWGRRVRHIWDRGYCGSGWIQAALAANVRFVVRWKKGNKLLDNWGEEHKASAIGRGKRSQSYRYLRDTRTKELIKVGVVVIPVTLLDHPQPLWLVIARLGKGREPWYLLTADPISALADAWALVLAYARRWQIEMVWRYSKSELAMESPRVWAWDVRKKLLLLATLAYAFLLHLLNRSFDVLRALLLRNWCHRTGKRYLEVAAPLYRLRSAISRLWQAAPPPGYHLPVLNSG
ncbi:MAG TPA: transposase [Candidatus Eisenbacteria bacterium]|nr:transposase [Candidatus Eisenbacteria bacterium]